MSLIPIFSPLNSFYETDAVVFDGTNDYMNRGANLTGIVDGKKGIVSFWVKFNGGDGSLQVIYAITLSNNTSFTVTRTAANQINITGRSGPGQPSVMTVISSSTVTVSSGWTHVMASWDSSISARNLYVNNTNVITGIIQTNTNINYQANGNNFIGSSVPSPSLLMNVDISDFYLNTTEYIDLSVSANRAKFINQTTLKPVNLGANGSTPTGTQPIVFQRCAPGDAASTFANNLGTGGNFTITGTLTVAPTSPSD